MSVGQEVDSWLRVDGHKILGPGWEGRAIPEPTTDVDPRLIRSRDQLRDALTALRLRAGLTVRDLATRAGLPSATVGGYVTARHLPSPAQQEQFRAVLRACGVGDHDLLAQWDEALVRVRLASDGRAGRRGVDGGAPYRGLEPFQPDDADLFFGREEFVSLVLARLTDLWHTTHSTGSSVGAGLRLMFVIGASGSGKSSLLRAGVFPTVVQGAIGDLGALNDAPTAQGASASTWHASIMMPGSDPLAALDRALEGVPTPRLLIIDQFEELYTLTTDEAERARFLADLGELGPDTLIVAGMRADFFPAAARDTAVLPALQDWQMVVPPMSQAGLRAAVVGPANARNAAVDDALVEAVMADVFPSHVPAAAARQNALPLLSHALLSTWERARRGRLTLADYRSAGGLAGAVQQSAEQAYDELTPVEQELARRVFLRLVNVDDDLVVTRRRITREELDALDIAPADRVGLATPSRRRVPVAAGPVAEVAEAAGHVAHVIERFVSRRLVTLDADTIEVSHDALLSAWPRLAEWIAADHAGLRVHRRLTTAANGWQQAEFDDNVLLRGTQLGGVEEWARDPDHHAAMNRLELDYLLASIRVRDAEQLAVHRRTNLLRRLVAALAGLLLVAAASTVYALHSSRVADGQRQAATAARDDALSREVAIESTRAATTDQALAEQLALAAYRISPTVDARSALLDTTAAGVVNRLVGPSGPTTLRLNPAGTLLAVSNAADATVALYRYDADRPGPRIGVIPAQSPADQVFALAFSPDGHTLAVGGQGGTVRLFNVSDPARPVLDATAPGGFSKAAEALAFNPAGTQLAAGGSQPPIRLWSVTDPRNPTLLPSPAGPAVADVVQTVAYSPDGTMLAAGGSAATLQLWQVTNLDAQPQALPLGTTTLDAVAFSPDSRSLVTASKDGSAAVINTGDPTAPAIAARLDTGFTSWANAVAYSPDGQQVAIGGSDGRLDEFDTTSTARTATITIASQLTAVGYSHDGRVLLAASADGTVRSWPVHQRTISGLGGPVFALGYDSSGRRLAVATSGKSGTASLWSTSSATGGSDDRGTSRLSSLAVPTEFGAAGGTGAISADGRLVATGNTRGQVLLATVTDAGAFDQLRELVGASQGIESVAFTPNGLTVAAGADDGYVHLWDVRDPANPVPLPALASGGEVVSIAFSPDGRYLAAASVDHHVHLWQVTDPAHPQPLPDLTGFANYAWSVAFSSDSKLVAAGGADDTIRIWNVAGPQQPHLIAGPLNGPTHYIFSLAFSPDDRTLAAAGGDGTVWTWALTWSAPPMLTATLHAANPGGSTYAVAFSPDGATLTAGGSAAQVVLWNASPESAAAAVCALRGDRLTTTEWAQYVPGMPYQDVCFQSAAH